MVPYTLLLISGKYRKNFTMLNIQSKIYGKKTAVQQNMSQQSYKFTIAQKSVKFLSLKNCFCKERKKVTASATDQLYTSKSRFYKRLIFLNSYSTPWQTFSNFNVGKAAYGTETEEVAATKPPKNQKLTKYKVDPTASMKLAVEYLKIMSIDEKKEKSTIKFLQTLW